MSFESTMFTHSFSWRMHCMLCADQDELGKPSDMSLPPLLDVSVLYLVTLHSVLWRLSCDYISSLVRYIFLFVAIWRTIQQVRLSDAQSVRGWRRMVHIFSSLLFPVSVANNCANSSERCLEWHSARSEGQVVALATWDRMAFVREYWAITQKH